MLEQGDILTLEDEKDYAVVSVTKIDDITYVYLMNTVDYSNFMFCSFDETDGLLEVDDPDLLDKLIEIFNKQLNG